MGIEAYQEAFTEATLEHREIVEQFEKLRVRMELIEKVIESLKPVVGFAGQATAFSAQPSNAFAPLPQGFESAPGTAQTNRSIFNSTSN